MLQRLQTIFMFIAAVAMLVILFFPFYKKVDSISNDTTSEYVIVNSYYANYERSTDGNVEILGQQSTVLISVGAILAAIVMFFSIFQYKKRMNQVKLNALFSLIAAATLGGMAYYTTKANQLFDPMLPGNYLMAFYLPVVAMLNNFLANRFIRKDEKLVRDSDRLR